MSKINLCFSQFICTFSSEHSDTNELNKYSFFFSFLKLDIVLYNYADTRLEEKREVLAIISAEGQVRWRPSSIYKSTCQINIQNFPYDHQECRMKFGSWTYAGDSIDIQVLGRPEINQELLMAWLINFLLNSCRLYS